MQRETTDGGGGWWRRRKEVAIAQVEGRQTEMGTRMEGERGGRERSAVKRKVSQAVGN